MFIIDLNRKNLKRLLKLQFLQFLQVCVTKEGFDDVHIVIISHVPQAGSHWFNQFMDLFSALAVCWKVEMLGYPIEVVTPAAARMTSLGEGTFLQFLVSIYMGTIHQEACKFKFLSFSIQCIFL